MTGDEAPEIRSNGKQSPLNTSVRALACHSELSLSAHWLGFGIWQRQVPMSYNGSCPETKERR